MKKNTGLFFILIFYFSFSNAQNVGIGTTSPQTKLHVVDSALGTIVTIENKSSANSSQLFLKTAESVNSRLGVVKWSDGAKGNFSGINVAGLSAVLTGIDAKGGLLIGNFNPNPIFFITNSNERLRISSAGYVGINNKTPAYWLDVKTDTGFAVSSSLTGISGAAISGVAYENLTAAAFEKNKYGLLGRTLQKGVGIGAFADSGTAVRASAPRGTAIYSTGKLRFTGISEGSGKVLTSDASGNATWQTPVSGGGGTSFGWTALGNNIYNGNTGFVGVHNNTPAYWLDVKTDTGYAINSSITGTTGASVAGTAFENLNAATAEKNAYGLLGRTLHNGVAIGAFSDSAVAIRTKSLHGVAIYASGKIRFTGILEGPGKILTSDVRGNATWQSLPASASAWSVAGNNIYNSNTAFVGINTTTPTYTFHVKNGTKGSLFIDNPVTNNGSTLNIYRGINDTTTSIASGLNVNVSTDKAAIFKSVASEGINVTTSSSSSAAAHFIAAGTAKVAVELESGFIKVSGTTGNKTAYLHTTAAGNTTANATTLTYSNPLSTDILIVNHQYVSQDLFRPYGVKWNGSQWTIFLEKNSVADTPTMPLGENFTVLVIRQ